MRGERENQRKSRESTAPRTARPRVLVRKVEDARGGAWVHGGDHRRFAVGYPQDGQACARQAKPSAEREQVGEKVAKRIVWHHFQ